MKRRINLLRFSRALLCVPIAFAFLAQAADHANAAPTCPAAFSTHWDGTADNMGSDVFPTGVINIGGGNSGGSTLDMSASLDFSPYFGPDSILTGTIDCNTDQFTLTASDSSGATLNGTYAPSDPLDDSEIFGTWFDNAEDNGSFDFLPDSQDLSLQQTMNPPGPTVANGAELQVTPTVTENNTEVGDTNVTAEVVTNANAIDTAATAIISPNCHKGKPFVPGNLHMICDLGDIAADSSASASVIVETVKAPIGNTINVTTLVSSDNDGPNALSTDDSTQVVAGVDETAASFVKGGKTISTGKTLSPALPNTILVKVPSKVAQSSLPSASGSTLLVKDPGAYLTLDATQPGTNDPNLCPTVSSCFGDLLVISGDLSRNVDPAHPLKGTIKTLAPAGTALWVDKNGQIAVLPHCVKDSITKQWNVRELPCSLKSKVSATMATDTILFIGGDPIMIRK
jgi:hypothetical protein